MGGNRGNVCTTVLEARGGGGRMTGRLPAGMGCILGMVWVDSLAGFIAQERELHHVRFSTDNGAFVEKKQKKFNSA